MSIDNQQDAESSFLKHVPCENCGSSDANSLYTDGHQYCFSCQNYIQGNQTETQGTHKKTPKGLLSFTEVKGIYTAIKARGLTEEICKKYNYWVAIVDGKALQIANYYDNEGNLVAQKTRDKDKHFSAKGHLTNECLFGKHLWNGGKKIIVLEGEIDTLSVAQVLNGKYPVVGLPNGAQSAKKVCAANYAYFDQFEEIILMYDMDEAGRKAVESSAPVLPSGKVKVAVLPLKDANECLLNGQAKAITEQIWNAQPWIPDGVVRAQEIKDRVITSIMSPRSGGVPFSGSELLNSKTLGAHPGEIILLTSGTGMGKSSYARQNILSWGLSGHKVGLAMLEESVEETIQDLIGLNNKVRLRQNPELLHEVVKDGRFDTWYDKLFNDDAFYLYDSFAEANIERLFARFSYMVDGVGCELLVLDHISIVVSAMDAVSDERRTIDRLMTKLKAFAKDKRVAILVLVHLKRPENGKPHEEGRHVQISDLRGSGALAHLSDTIIALERDQQGNDPNYVRIRLLKSRLIGVLGYAGSMRYNQETGWLEEINAENQNLQGAQQDDVECFFTDGETAF